MCKYNLREEILERIVGIDIKTFSRLSNVASDIEAFLAKYSSTDEAKQEKRQPGDLATANGVASSPPTKLSKPRKQILLQEKLRKPYSFPSNKTRVLFELALEQNKFVLPSLKRPEDSKRRGDLLFCFYHQMVGHAIEDCYVFKGVAQSLIDKGEMQLGEYKVDPPCPHEATARQEAR
ncbi:hypothetical protein Taro_003162 [Colocasia esculenta]|uniref:Uncharacterized protein n=1 Tax=Colocasia esculenta TaxID=4460 RepID=A0A843TQZ0_COLES|nr:hypothetical protein [Colocasia esculenta]